MNREHTDSKVWKAPDLPAGVNKNGVDKKNVKAR